MNIGLWTDGTNSLPLMKISAYHKSLGDKVSFIEPEGHYDRVYLSKVFNLPGIKKIPQAPPITMPMKPLKAGQDGLLMWQTVEKPITQKEINLCRQISKPFAPTTHYTRRTIKQSVSVQEDARTLARFVWSHRKKGVSQSE